MTREEKQDYLYFYCENRNAECETCVLNNSKHIWFAQCDDDCNCPSFLESNDEELDRAIKLVQESKELDKAHDVNKLIRLKPCPFCGEELITIANGQYYSHKREQDKEKQCFGAVWCFEVDDEEFIKLWNTRKPIDKVLKQLQSYKDDIRQWNDTYTSGQISAYDRAINIVKAGGIDD